MVCDGPQVWPDGTPKKFQGKESWKNWIDWDSPFNELTDELNRKRHFFWKVDSKGRLWRLELDRPGQTFGQMKDSGILDYFFSHLELNATGEYEQYPFLSRRRHEMYFVCCDESPVVFNDLRCRLAPSLQPSACGLLFTLCPRALILGDTCGVQGRRAEAPVPQRGDSDICKYPVRPPGAAALERRQALSLDAD